MLFDAHRVRVYPKGIFGSEARVIEGFFVVNFMHPVFGPAVAPGHQEFYIFALAAKQVLAAYGHQHIFRHRCLSSSIFFDFDFLCFQLFGRQNGVRKVPKVLGEVAHVEAILALRIPVTRV